MYAATMGMSSAHITPTHRTPALSRSHSTYEFVQPTLLQAPIISFDWLLSLNFTSYVYGRNYLTPDDQTAIKRFYVYLEKRKNSIARHSMYEMTGQVDNFYSEVAGTQRRSSSVSSGWEYRSTSSSAAPTDPIAHENRRGSRWQSLVDALSPEILLVDRYASNAFVSTLEHGSDEEFEMIRADICAPGSRTWEICLKLTGVQKMIEDLEEGKNNLAPEVRKWIAGEIERRVNNALSSMYATSSRGSVHSLHADIPITHV